MRKFFLIPLITLMCSVMAWGATITVGEGGDQTSLAAAINAASAGDKLQLVSNLTVSSEVNFNKALTVDFNSYTITATGNWLIVVNANLTLEATNGGGITAPKGCLDVYGSSKVTINGGTFTTSITNSGAAIWGNGSSCELEFNNGTINAQSAGIVYEGGRVIINGGNFNGEYGGALEVKGGYFEINDGEFISHCSTTHMGSNWAYAVIADNCTFVMNGGHIEGVQGGLSIGEDCAGTINNGEIETRHGVDGQHNNHYALYVSTGAVVNVYDGKFKVETPSAGGNRVVLCGNNDAYNYYGVVNMYGGKYQEKAYVTKQKNAESYFPASVPSTSAWYTAFQEKDAANAFAPLPAGYEYYDITEGEDYEAGYRYGVRAVAGKESDAIDPAKQAAQEADPTYTIPWQQATTWASDEVPVENTIVTIPVDATVTVSKDEETKTAVADQVFVAQGATLKVEEGTTLTIGEGGLNIGNGGQLVVEEGAIVTVGDAGIITQDDPSTLVVSATETGSGALLISPAVTENTHPYATVEMYAKAHKDGDTWYAQHFGIPTYNTPEIGWAPGNTWVHKFGENGWENITSLSELQPFVGYKLTNNSAVAAGKYTFTGNIIGNGNAPISFVKPYYNLLANSYTAPMSLAALFTNIEAQYGNDVDLTVWIYKSDEDRHVSVTKAAVLSGEDPEAITTIAPMQGFILYCGPTQPADGEINYQQAIWNNTDKTGVPIMAPARDAQDESVHATIVVTSEKSKDEVVLRENNEYSNAFDNGADARKYMSERVFDFYSVNNGEAFSQVATDDLAGTELTMKAKDETVYTMSFRNVNNFDYEIRDNLSGAIIPVVEGTTYEFTMAEGTTAEARFEIVGGKKVVTDIENIGAVKAAKGVYTVLGQYLGESSLLNTLPTGIYVVDGQRIVK